MASGIRRTASTAERSAAGRVEVATGVAAREASVEGVVRAAPPVVVTVTAASAKVARPAEAPTAERAGEKEAAAAAAVSVASGQEPMADGTAQADAEVEAEARRAAQNSCERGKAPVASEAVRRAQKFSSPRHLGEG